MRNITLYILGILLFTSCHKLDLNPLSEGSSETWFADEDELEMSINDLYRDPFWPLTKKNGDGGNDAWTDDWMYREALTPITNGKITSEWSVSNEYWKNAYKAITRCNLILSEADKLKDEIPEERLNSYKAEARFIRACQYSRLIFYFGNVIYYKEPLDLEGAFKLGRTNKDSILREIYKDFDFASEYLPEEYSSSNLQRATKGAAYGMKARTALYQNDFKTARDAAKSCIDLDIYDLEPDFSSLFLTSTKKSPEFVFILPRSVEFNNTLSIQDAIPRNDGGWGAWSPTWELFCSFLCSDGLPIDESPLYNPQRPFENRDPRCTATIVKFGTPHLGFIYQPHPDSLEVLNLSTGKKQKNQDTRSNQQFASFNGLLWNKGIDNTWLENGYKVDPVKMILRYADVLLMYAEAKIELDDIDESVLNAINRVRARAYGVALNDTNLYPAVSTTDQNQLRKILRMERRMEFAFEGKRYADLIRWKIADKVLNRPIYGMLDPDELRQKIVDKGLWFFPETPPIDKDGIPDFSDMYNKGLIKKIVDRSFDKDRQYLWPIPSKDIQINENIKQNPNY